MDEIRHVEGVVVDRDPRLEAKFSRILVRRPGILGWMLGGPLRLILGLAIAIPLLALFGTIMTVFFVLALLLGRKNVRIYRFR